MTRLAITRWPPTGMPAPTNAPTVPTTRPLLLAVRIWRKRKVGMHPALGASFVSTLYESGPERFLKLLQRQAG